MAVDCCEKFTLSSQTTGDSSQTKSKSRLWFSSLLKLSLIFHWVINIYSVTSGLMYPNLYDSVHPVSRCFLHSILSILFNLPGSLSVSLTFYFRNMFIKFPPDRTLFSSRFNSLSMTFIQNMNIYFWMWLSGFWLGVMYLHFTSLFLISLYHGTFLNVIWYMSVCIQAQTHIHKPTHFHMEFDRWCFPFRVEWYFTF